MSRKFFLKEWRKAKGLSQEELGARLNRSGATISRLETGDINYTRESLEELAEALNLEPADLLRDPSRPDYQLWRIIQGIPRERQETVLRLAKALEDDATPPRTGTR